MPWKTTGDANSADTNKVQQGNSSQPELLDVWFSGNVIINGREAGLWNDPDKSATFASGVSVDGIQLNAIDQTLWDASVGETTESNTEAGKVYGSDGLPSAGAPLETYTTSTYDPITMTTVTTTVTIATPVGNQISAVTDGQFGTGYDALVAMVNTCIREGLMPNKPWKAKNPGTDGTGRNGAKLSDPPPSGNNCTNIMQLYQDLGFKSVANDGVHWCAAYVGAMLKRAGLPYKQSLGSRAYKQDGGWATTWADPKDPNTWRYNDVMYLAGHVCFIRGFDPATKDMLLAGGNQGQDMNEVRWSGASYFNKVEAVGRAWPDPGKKLPGVGEGKAMTKVFTHGNPKA